MMDTQPTYALMDEEPEIPDLPGFLIRDSANQSEITRMKPASVKPTAAPETEAATAPEAVTETPVKAPKVKANGTAKPKAVKAAPKAVKAVKAKAAKPVKAKAVKAANPANSAVDRFGFKATSLKSQAAAMYASKGGATLGEVKAALNSTQFNVLNDIRELKNFTVTDKKEDGEGNRKVSRFFIKAKK